MLSYILFLALVILKSSTLLKHRDLVACVVAYVYFGQHGCDIANHTTRVIVHAQMFDCCELCSSLV